MRVFENLTAVSPIRSLINAAVVAACEAASADMASHGRFPLDNDAREMLESWLGAYRHDEQILSALSDVDRAIVLDAAWENYRAAVIGATKRAA